MPRDFNNGHATSRRNGDPADLNIIDPVQRMCAAAHGEAVCADREDLGAQVVGVLLVYVEVGRAHEHNWWTAEVTLEGR